MSLALQLERDVLAAGDWIRGGVTVQHPIGARSLEVLVSLREKTEDYDEVALTGRTGFLHQGPLQPGWSFPFQLQLPPQVVPPYRTRWCELYWEVDAKADVPSARDAHARRRIVVLPEGVRTEQLALEEARQAPNVLTAAAQAVGIAAAPAPDEPTASSAPGSHAAGWYADPWLEKRLRWWDGNAWTGSTAD